VSSEEQSFCLGRAMQGSFSEVERISIQSIDAQQTSATQAISVIPQSDRPCYKLNPCARRWERAKIYLLC